MKEGNTRRIIVCISIAIIVIAIVIVSFVMLNNSKDEYNDKNNIGNIYDHEPDEPIDLVNHVGQIN